jgi:hypothetical protein
MYPHPPFNQDQFALCYRAYTAALQDIQSQEGRVGQAPLGDGTCFMVALRIIEASANGERDLSGLKQFALSGLVARH